MFKGLFIAWMRDNDTDNWRHGLFLTQWAMNTTCSKATKVIPYKALLGVAPKVGLATNLPTELLKNIRSGIFGANLLRLVNNQVQSQQVN